MSKVVKFIVFGKDGCGLCEKRLEFLSKFKSLNETKYDIAISYYDVSQASGLTEFSISDHSKEIPSVEMYVDGNFVKVWQGYDNKEDVPTTGAIVKILENGEKNE